jgi:uncharacterized coiled-coil protein SlyX
MTQEIVGNIQFDNSNQQAVIDFQNHLISELNGRVAALQATIEARDIMIEILNENLDTIGKMISDINNSMK